MEVDYFAQLEDLLLEEFRPTPFHTLRKEIGVALENFETHIRAESTRLDEDKHYEALALWQAAWDFRKQVMMSYWLLEKNLENARWAKDYG